MALTATQEVMVARIIRKPLSVVRAKILEPEEEIVVAEDIDLWESKQNSIAVELDGEVKYRVQILLDEIRDRVRGIYDLPPYSEESVMGSAGSFAIPNIQVF